MRQSMSGQRLFFYGVLLPLVSSVEHSANPSTSCASGHSGLRQAHISRSTWKRCGLGMPAPSEEGFRAVSSDAFCRFARIPVFILGSGNGTESESSVRERGHIICTSIQQGKWVYSRYFIVPKKDGGCVPF